MSDNGNRLADLWSEYQDRINQATRKEEKDSLLAWIPVPPEEWGKFKITPLTIRKYALLSIDDFWTDEDGDARIPILRFLWVMSPEFSTDPEKAKHFRATYYFENFEGMNDRIHSFINRAFEFSPAKKQGNKKKSSNEWISSLVDAFASEYGWTDEQILDAPISRLLLLLRRIRERNSDKPITFNSEADRLRQEFMDKANRN
mgnify:CR=1 FL=1